jgi:hypothetical protein
MPAQLLCFRTPRPHGVKTDDVWTRWPTPEAAATALGECACSPDCTGSHLVAWADANGDTHVTAPHPDPPPLGEQLAELYPRERRGDAEMWATPAELNEPLEKPVGTSPMPERMERGNAVAVQRAIYPVALGHLLPDAPELGPTSPLPDETGGAGVPVPPPPPSGCTGAQTDCHYKHDRTVPDPPERRCGVDGCERKHVAKNTCQWHYRHQWDHLPPLPITDLWPKPPRRCEIPGCVRVHTARGMCQRHYDHWKNHGRNGVPPCPSPTQPAKPVRWPTPAEIAATSLPPWHWKRRWLQKPAS